MNQFHRSLGCLSAPAAAAAVLLLLASPPVPAGLSLAGSRAFVADPVDGTLTVLDLDTMAPAGPPIPGIGASFIGASTTSGDRLFLLDAAAGLLRVFDTDTLAVIDEEPLGVSPRSCVLAPDETRLFVACEGSRDLWIYRPDEASAFRAADLSPRRPTALAAVPGGTDVLVLFGAEGELGFFRTSDNRMEDAFLDVGEGARFLLPSPDGALLTVLGDSLHSKVDLGLREVVATAASEAKYAAATARRWRAWGAGVDSDGDPILHEFDLGAAVPESVLVPVGQEAAAILLSPDDLSAWFCFPGVGEVREMALGDSSFTGRFAALGSAPSSLAARFTPAPERGCLVPTRVEIRDAGEGRVSLRAEGWFDDGGGSPDFAGAATVRIPGRFTRSSVLREGRGGWFEAAEGDLQLSLRPEGGGSSRGRFRLTIPSLIGSVTTPDGWLQLLLQVAGMPDSRCVLTPMGGGFSLGTGRGHLRTPGFYPLKATFLSAPGRPDQLALKCVFATSGTPPGEDDVVRLRMGEGSAIDLPGSLFRRRGPLWTYDSGPGSSRLALRIDYARGRIAIRATGLGLSIHEAGTLDLLFDAGLGDGLLGVRVRPGGLGGRRTY